MATTKTILSAIVAIVLVVMVTVVTFAFKADNKQANKSAVETATYYNVGGVFTQIPPDEEEYTCQTGGVACTAILEGEDLPVSFPANQIPNDDFTVVLQNTGKSFQLIH